MLENNSSHESSQHTHTHATCGLVPWGELCTVVVRDDRVCRLHRTYVNQLPTCHHAHNWPVKLSELSHKKPHTKNVGDWSCTIHPCCFAQCVFLNTRTFDCALCDQLSSRVRSSQGHFRQRARATLHSPYPQDAIGLRVLKPLMCRGMMCVYLDLVCCGDNRTLFR